MRIEVASRPKTCDGTTEADPDALRAGRRRQRFDPAAHGSDGLFATTRTSCGVGSSTGPYE